MFKTLLLNDLWTLNFGFSVGLNEKNENQMIFRHANFQIDCIFCSIQIYYNQNKKEREKNTINLFPKLPAAFKSKTSSFRYVCAVHLIRFRRWIISFSFSLFLFSFWKCVSLSWLFSIRFLSRAVNTNVCLLHFNFDAINFYAFDLFLSRRVNAFHRFYFFFFFYYFSIVGRLKIAMMSMHFILSSIHFSKWVLCCGLCQIFKELPLKGHRSMPIDTFYVLCFVWRPESIDFCFIFAPLISISVMQSKAKRQSRDENYLVFCINLLCHINNHCMSSYYSPICQQRIIGSHWIKTRKWQAQKTNQQKLNQNQFGFVVIHKFIFVFISQKKTKCSNGNVSNRFASLFLLFCFLLVTFFISFVFIRNANKCHLNWFLLLHRLYGHCFIWLETAQFIVCFCGRANERHVDSDFKLTLNNPPLYLNTTRSQIFACVSFSHSKVSKFS